MTNLSKPVADFWFSIQVCDSNILRIRETNIDPYAIGDIWLVRGRDRDLVIDTGCGILSPAPLIEAIAARPVTAIALNCYYDHAGGWHNFTDRACHPLDAPQLENSTAEQASVGDYLNDQTLLSLPYSDYKVENYQFIGAKATQLVEEGHVFDLGDRKLEVLHMPGRSAGGLAIWEKATGSLFTSDMMYDGDHGLAWPPENPKAYCNSIKRMRDLPVQYVYPGHYGIMDSQRLNEIVEEQLSELSKTCF